MVGSYNENTITYYLTGQGQHLLGEGDDTLQGCALQGKVSLASTFPALYFSNRIIAGVRPTGHRDPGDSTLAGRRRAHARGSR